MWCRGQKWRSTKEGEEKEQRQSDALALGGRLLDLKRRKQHTFETRSKRMASDTLSETASCALVYFPSIAQAEGEDPDVDIDSYLSAVAQEGESPLVTRAFFSVSSYPCVCLGSFKVALPCLATITLSAMSSITANMTSASSTSATAQPLKRPTKKRSKRSSNPVSSWIWRCYIYIAGTFSLGMMEVWEQLLVCEWSSLLSLLLRESI